MLGCHGLDLDLLKMILESLQAILQLGEKVRAGVRALALANLHVDTSAFSVKYVGRWASSRPWPSTRSLTLFFPASAHTMQIAQREQTRNRYADIIEECGGLEHIEQLQQHQNAKVYHLSHDLVTNYFSEQNEQEDGMQLADPAAGTSYSFAASAPPTGGFQL